MNLALISMDALWRNALAAIPLAIIVALACRYLPMRAATRHALWLIVLLSLAFPPLSMSREVSGHVSRMLASIAPAAEQPAPPVSLPPSGLPQSPARADFFPNSNAPAAFWRRVAQSQSSGILLRELAAAEKHESAVTARKLSLIVTPQPLEAPVIERTPKRLAASIQRDAVAQVATPPPALAREFQRHKNSKADSSPIPKSDESTSPSIAPSLAAIQWQQWFAGVFALRDAIVRLAPIPTSLWLGGCIAIVLVLVIRTIRFRRIVNAAAPAPRQVRREVDRAARKIGLRTSPQTFISNRRVSPMIWCGCRRVLLLPASLWSELDDTGRDAVLLHELAHLRRRDHWVRWIELLIGCVYWWHPVVWFVRKRLRDEADFCCDAWVTALLPSSRGAYARALVATRQYVSESRDATPAVGLGITTNRTKRFARRLNMVMTDRSAPKLSAIGGGMTICLALAAWLAAPLWACPPDEKKATCTVVAPSGKAKFAVTAPRAKAVPAEEADATTFERHMAEREAAVARAPRPAQVPQPPQPPQQRLRALVAPSHDGGDVDARLNRLEERLNRLSEHLEQLLHQPHGQAPRGVAPTSPVPPVAPVPPGPPAPGPSAFGGTYGIVSPHPHMSLGHGFGVPDDGQLITKMYRLPEGKCGALYELMARSDVPVRVAAAGKDAISVEATARQHGAFGAFVALIHPEGGHQHAQSQPREMIAMERALAGQLALRAGDLARAKVGLEAQMKARGKHVEALKQSLGGQKANLQRQIEELHRRARELESKARQLEKKSSKMQSDAEIIDDDARREALMAQALALGTQAEELELHAEEHNEQAEHLEDLIASLEDELFEAFEAMAEEFAALADDLEIEFDEAELEAVLASEEHAAAVEIAAQEAAEAASEVDDR